MNVFEPHKINKKTYLKQGSLIENLDNYLIKTMAARTQNIIVKIYSESITIVVIPVYLKSDLRFSIPISKYF